MIEVKTTDCVAPKLLGRSNEFGHPLDSADKLAALVWVESVVNRALPRAKNLQVRGQSRVPSPSQANVHDPCVAKIPVVLDQAAVTQSAQHPGRGGPGDTRSIGDAGDRQSLWELREWCEQVNLGGGETGTRFSGGAQATSVHGGGKRIKCPLEVDDVAILHSH